MQDVKRLALVGPPGSGKTTIAVKWVKSGPVVSFAQALRWEIAKVFGPAGGAHEFMRTLTEPPQKYQWRELEQAWGMRRRAQNPDYWVRRAAESIAVWEGMGFTRIAVDDCRFPNEYEMLRDKGFVFVRLAPQPGAQATTDTESQHESERYWPDFDCYLELDWREGPAVQAQRIEDAVYNGGE